jgi:hypothetical protein
VQNVPPPPDRVQPGIAVYTHPAVGAQESAVQGLPSLQSSAAPPHVLAWHTSLVVHSLPSSQGAPSFEVWTQPAIGSQLSIVHGLLSSQLGAGAAWQLPATHTSGLQAVPAPTGMLQSLVVVHGTHPGIAAN